MNTSSKTIAYPVAATYDARSGLDHHGFAATAEEARDLYVRGLDAEDAASVGLPVLRSIECSHLGRAGSDASDFEWQGEIEAGYASAQDCGAWRKIVVETWSFG